MKSKKLTKKDNKVLLPFWRYLLPALLEKITGKKRYLPKIEWSDTSYVHNIFRAWEWIAFRKYGIRAEMSSSFDEKTGKGVYTFHSFEAVCAHTESLLRGLIPKYKIEKVYIPVLQPIFAGFGMPQTKTPYLFAIAVDATSGISNSTSSSRTHSHTCTGSDRILFAFPFNTQSATISSITYNSADMTLIRSQNMTYSPLHTLYAYYKQAPSTGANDIVVTYSGSCYNFTQAVSYTGALQSGSPIDGQNSTNGGSGTSITSDITVSVSDSWMIAVGRLDNSGTLSGNNSTGTARNTTSDGGNIVADSNGTVASGTRTGGIQSSASGNRVIIVFNFQVAGVSTSVKDIIGTGFIPYAR